MRVREEPASKRGEKIEIVKCKGVVSGNNFGFERLETRKTGRFKKGGKSKKLHKSDG